MKKPLIIFAFVLFLASPAHAEVVWAFVGPLTGSVASWGTITMLGAQQAVEDINRSGGINGEKITLKTYDSVCDPKQAVAVANRIAAEGIHFVIQGDCSGSSIASAKIFIEENIVVINPFASNPKFTDEGGPTIFRTIYRDDRNAPVLAQAIVKRFPHTKLGIIHDKSAYGFGVAEQVQKQLNAAGVKEVLFDSYDPESRDFSALITRLKQAGVETLFVGGYPVDIGTLARQMQQVGFKTQIIAGDLTDNDFWKIAQSAGEGALFAWPPDPRQSEGTAKVRAALEKKHQEYNGLTLYAYASAQVLEQAIQMTSSSDPVKTAAMIHQKTFDTILGAWSFDKKGDIQNIPLVLYRWHDGKYAGVEK